MLLAGTFLDVQFWDRIPRASKGPRGELWNPFGRVLGSFLLISDQKSVRHTRWYFLNKRKLRNYVHEWNFNALLSVHFTDASSS